MNAHPVQIPEIEVRFMEPVPRKRQDASTCMPQPVDFTPLFVCAQQHAKLAFNLRS